MQGANVTYWLPLIGYARGLPRMQSGALGGGEAASVKHVAEIRYLPPGAAGRPTASQRFREGERIYAIRGVAETDDRRDRLTIWLEEGAAP